MKRKLAGFGLAFAGLELFAAALPPLVTVPVAAFLVVLLVLFRRRSVRWPLLGAVCGLVYFGLFTALIVSPKQALAGQTVQCTAVAGTDCTAAYTEGRLRGTLQITAIEGRRVSLSVYCASFPGTEAGERFTGTFALSELKQDRYRLSRLARGVILQAEYQSNGEYTSLGPSAAPRYALYRLRQELSGRLSTWLPRGLAGVECAMLLGDRSALRDAEVEAFRTAGVSHLLAVSGLHMALLCGLLAAGAGRRRKFYRPLLLLQACLALSYMLLTGLPVSVRRAGLVFLIALVGSFFLQPPDLLTSTGAAALLLGLCNAYAPCDLGFQLSFAAVLGVQAAAALTRWEERRFGVKKPVKLLHHFQNAALRLVGVIQAAALAGIATLPVLIVHGLATSGVSVLTNLLVVWMLSPALVLGMVVLLLGLCPPLAPVMHLVSLLLAVWLKIMVGLVSWCAALPMARLYLPPRYTLVTMAVLGALALLFWLRGRFCWYFPVAAGVTAAAVCLFVFLEQDVVHLALVGTAGNPCAVCIQNGEAVVFYRGGTANERAVAEYLEEHGAPRTELLIDLRQKPTETKLQAEAILCLQQQKRDGELAVLDNVAITLYHRSSGNLAILEVDGVKIAMMAGNIELKESVKVDLFCAAGAVSDSVLADTIVYTAAAPKWLDAAGTATLLQGQDTPVITLAPGRPIAYEEVRQIAVQ